MVVAREPRLCGGEFIFQTEEDEPIESALEDALDEYRRNNAWRQDEFVHECNARCEGDVHCEIVWGQPGGNGVISTRVQLASFGLRYVAHEPAREAPDIETASELRQAGIRVTGEMPAGVTLRDLAPMLVWFRYD